MTIYAEDSYERITKEQAENWIKSITYDELLEQIIEWDYIEHTAPEFNFPRYVAIIKGNDVYLQPEYNFMTYTHGYLSYTYTIPSYEYKNIIPKKESTWQWYLIGGIGLFIGGSILGGWLGYEIGK